MSAGTTFAPAPEDQAAYGLLQHAAPDNVAHLHGGVQLAADDSPDILRGVAVVKPGLFNGVFEVTAEDIDAWVQRFDELRGVFRPPMRLDHSWEVMNVIGRFVELYRENRVDESQGGVVVPMLVGDVQLVGTPEENARIKAWVKSGKLDERSSEFYPYRTNTQAEYPSVFAGCAFVDIPAVEGLGSITLRRAGATLSATDTEGTPMTATTDAPATDPEVDPNAAPVEDPAPAADPAAVEEPAPTDPVEDPEQDPDEGDGELVDPAGNVPPAQSLALNRDADIEAEVERRVALRLESEQRLTTLRSRGVLTPAVTGHAEALLRHTDQAVRDAAFAVLDAQRPPVKLGAVAGTLGTVSSGAPAGDRTTEVIHLDMTREDATSAYLALDADGREKYRPELAAWQAAHPAGD